MHYGEVMGSWSFVAANNGLISGYETFVNHVGDKDLKKLLTQVIEMMQSHNKEVVELLKITVLFLHLHYQVARKQRLKIFLLVQDLRI